MSLLPVAAQVCGLVAGSGRRGNTARQLDRESAGRTTCCLCKQAILTACASPQLDGEHIQHTHTHIQAVHVEEVRVTFLDNRGHCHLSWSQTAAAAATGRDNRLIKEASKRDSGRVASTNREHGSSSAGCTLDCVFVFSSGWRVESESGGCWWWRLGETGGSDVVIVGPRQ